LVLLIASVTSCTPEPVIPDQDKIYSSYILNYNQSENKTSAKASFYFNSPDPQNTQKLELNSPARVEFNDDVLVFNTDDRCYEKDFIGAISSDFVYTNYHGSIYTNNALMLDSIGMILLADSADTQFDFYFELFGVELDSTEELEIEVESINSGLKMGYTFTSISGLIIQIQNQELIALGVGAAVIKATRRKINSGIQGTPVGGEITCEYAVQDTVIIY